MDPTQFDMGTGALSALILSRNLVETFDTKDVLVMLDGLILAGQDDLGFSFEEMDDFESGTDLIVEALFREKKGSQHV